MLQEFFEWVRAEEGAGRLEFDIKREASREAVLQS